MDEWVNYAMRRVALEVSQSRYYKVDLCCTSYDPTTHTVKGIIVPHGIETGFIALKAPQGSQQSGTGVFIGPTPGDASSLENGGQFQGDILEVHFDMGDPNNVSAYPKMSQPQNPPQVQSGEMLIQHQSGHQFYYKQDNSITLLHGVSKGSLVADAEGNWTLSTNDKNVTLNAGQGSHTLQAKNISILGQVAVQGDINQTGNHTVSGTVTAATGDFSSGTFPSA